MNFGLICFGRDIIAKSCVTYCLAKIGQLDRSRFCNGANSGGNSGDNFSGEEAPIDLVMEALELLFPSDFFREFGADADPNTKW